VAHPVQPKEHALVVAWRVVGHLVSRVVRELDGGQRVRRDGSEIARSRAEIAEQGLYPPHERPHPRAQRRSAGLGERAKRVERRRQPPSRRRERRHGRAEAVAEALEHPSVSRVVESVPGSFVRAWRSGRSSRASASSVRFPETIRLAS